MQHLPTTFSDIDAELLSFSLDAVRVYSPSWDGKTGLKMMLTLSGDSGDTERNGSPLPSLMSVVPTSLVNITVMLSADIPLGVIENVSVSSWPVIPSWKIPLMATTLGAITGTDSAGMFYTMIRWYINLVLFLPRKLLRCSNALWKTGIRIYRWHAGRVIHYLYRALWIPPYLYIVYFFWCCLVYFSRLGPN